MADWLGPVVSGVIEFSGSFVPVKKLNPRLQSAPLWKRLFAMLLIGVLVTIGVLAFVYFFFIFIAFIAKG